MFKNKYITRFLSGFLLLVFVLGITPKKFLHDVFATHIDLTSELTNKPIKQLSKSGFNCNCDNLVAESLFEGSTYVGIVHFHSCVSHNCFEEYSYLSSPAFFSLLRGPPLSI